MEGSREEKKREMGEMGRVREREGERELSVT